MKDAIISNGTVSASLQDLKTKLDNIETLMTVMLNKNTGGTT